MNDKTLYEMEEIEGRIRTEARVLTVLPLDGHKVYHEQVCQHITVDGLYCEFGVYRGSTITNFSEHIGDNVIYGFDSFEGLPDKWNDENPQHCYSLAGQIPPGPLNKQLQTDPGMYTTAMHYPIVGWNSNIELIKGMVQDTVPIFLQQHQGPIAFAHIDIDIYSAAKSVLENIQDRLVNGTILAFDELLDYPEYKEHELKAFAELLLDHPRLGYVPLIYQNNGYSYQQVCIRIIK